MPVFDLDDELKNIILLTFVKSETSTQTLTNTGRKPQRRIDGTILYRTPVPALYWTYLTHSTIILLCNAYVEFVIVEPFYSVV